MRLNVLSIITFKYNPFKYNRISFFLLMEEVKFERVTSLIKISQSNLNLTLLNFLNCEVRKLLTLKQTKFLGQKLFDEYEIFD